MEYEYDIAISFAGENRDIAEKLAKKLRAEGVQVFYDRFYEADLWGRNGYEYFVDVFSKKARFCIMLISTDYARKAWTTHERRAAQERAIKDEEPYILPVRLDDTDLPGFIDTVFYLDYRDKTINEIVAITLEKLGNSKEEIQSKITKSKDKEAEGNMQPRMPNVKKKYSDKDKEKFLYESFEFIKKYIRNGLIKIEKEHPKIETSFRKIHDFKFIGNIYSDGNKIHAFKIWIGGMSTTDSICFQEGTINLDRDNTYNEMIHTKIEDNKLRLEASMSQMYFGSKSNIQTPKDAAAYLWERIISPLEF